MNETMPLSPLEQELRGHISQLVSQRDNRPAVPGPNGLEPSWVQHECAALLDVVNEMRVGLGLPEVELADVRWVEYRVSTAWDGHTGSHVYEVSYAQALANLVLMDDDA
uniref:hypothetical protein n=1 Tax=Nonomuraea sp. CA-251285 TaxID=3240002 RepID=UPI003F494B8A